MWWLIGYGIAFGYDEYGKKGGDGTGFVGEDKFALSGDYFRGSASGTAPDLATHWAQWLFTWGFCAASTTIVSGAVAERTSFRVYSAYAFSITSFIFPLAAHWVWSSSGFLSPFLEDTDKLVSGCGVIDFAGSLTVHCLGGTAAFVTCVMVGPRIGRYVNGEVCNLPQNSWEFQTVGTLLLWVGWFGFNGVSAQHLTEEPLAAARAMCNSAIAAGTACITTVVLGVLRTRSVDVSLANNGALAGLVSITGCCAVVDPEGAFIIGALASPVFYSSAIALHWLEVDDVVLAVPVHLACGVWGTIAAGLFVSQEGYAIAYYPDRADKCCGAFYGCGGDQLGAQLGGLLVMTTWSAACIIAVMNLNRFLFGRLRTLPTDEDQIMDASIHRKRPDDLMQEVAAGRPVRSGPYIPRNKSKGGLHASSASSSSNRPLPGLGLPIETEPPAERQSRTGDRGDVKVEDSTTTTAPHTSIREGTNVSGSPPVPDV